MEMLIKILNNKIVYPALITTLGAQVLKLIVDYYRDKDYGWSSVFSTGGMPSTHAATVSSLVTSLAKYEVGGLSSLSFGSSLVFAFIVMYDAAGIRRRAGEHAVMLNKVVDVIRDENGKKVLANNLVEVLGHTPVEVLMGAIFGFLVTWYII